jgi:hypothetical protein
MSVSVNGTTGVTIGTSGATLTFPDSSTQNTAATGFGFKNRIINGAMVIDQRNAGASVTPTNGSYGLDRWGFNATVASKFTAQQNAASVTPPAGFRSYLGVTSSSAYSVLSSDIFSIYQAIEGFNVADLAWGTASAATITISFWVRSSLTGTFGGALRNGAADRAYPFTYSIPTANTWTTISVTIAGDTSGTWLTTNGIGINLSFGLGGGSTYSGTAGAWSGAGNFITATGATSVVGTNGATFYITGVQLEKGSTATSFDYRPYGTELALAQRYFETSYNAGTAIGDTTVVGATYVRASGTQPNIQLHFKVSKRTTPDMVYYAPGSGTVANFRNTDASSNLAVSGTNGTGTWGATPYANTGADQASYAVQFTASAEL